MNIFKVPPNTLTPYENNPRLNEASINTVAESITKFGFQQPIVVDNQNVIIVGHTRWLAALKLGLSEVPVIVASELNLKQARAYRIADNKTAEGSKWDEKKLLEELLGLDEFTGFSEQEVEELAKAEEEDLKIFEQTKEFKSKFIIEVICEDEEDQQIVFKTMTNRGYKCRILSM